MSDGALPPRDDTTGEEPDYRFLLANERTFLAWLRTALAFFAAAVALAQFVPPFGFDGGREALSVLLVLLGVACSLGGAWRWRAADAAMRTGRSLPSTGLPWLLAAGLALIGVATGIALAVGGGS